jgi:biopolymer transport protein ExbD
VTDTELLVQGRVVGRIADIMASDDLVIPALKQALMAQTDRVLRQESMDDIEGREVTIMGDKDIPYSLLKKVMATCTDADYGQLSLAVMQKTSDASFAAMAPTGG